MSPETVSLSKPLPRGCTNFKLRQMLRVVSRLYDAELARAGLKGTQFSLLSNLSSLGPIQPNELARHMGMDASTLSRNLRVVSELGWAEQGPGTDARSRLIALTPAGRSKLAEARRYWKKAQQSLNDTLGQDKVAALHVLLDFGLERLEEAGEATLAVR